MSQIEAQFRVVRDGFTLDVALSLPGEGISALFGPSGSGKTSCLRAIAGLEQLPGRLQVGDEIWQDDSRGLFVPPHRRAIGYVFQEASLFPHLSVRQNLDYGRRRLAAGVPRGDLEETAELLGIRPLLDRTPHSLSGGERQRAAIARALLCAPRLLLMDEPLAALDLKRKQEILPYLERLHQELAIPVIYVSHAPDEVARLADHLVLLNQGSVVASGPLTETLAWLDLPPAFADDVGVVWTTRLAGHADDGLSRLTVPGGELWVAERREPLGTPLRCRIHARDVSLSLTRAADSSILNLLPATVTALAPADTPGHVLVRLALGPTPLLARITARSAHQLALAPGMALWAQIKAVALL